MDTKDYFKYLDRLSKMEFRQNVFLALTIGVVSYVVLSKVQDMLIERRASQKLHGL